MNFTKRFLKSSLMTKGLEERGFHLSETKYDTRLVYSHFSSKLVFPELFFSECNDGKFQCGIFLSSLVVSHWQKNLKTAERERIPFLKPDYAQPLLSTDLYWLRCNSEATNSNSEDLYQLDEGSDIEKFFFDLDTYGKPYYEKYSDPLELINLLKDTDAYPRHTKLGGAPGSSEPYTFATILLIELGKKEDAVAMLDHGTGVYAVSPESSESRIYRSENFAETKRKILRIAFT